MTDVQREAAERGTGESVPAHLDNSEEEQPELEREGSGGCGDTSNTRTGSGG